MPDSVSSLSSRHPRTYTHDFRVALISMFSLENLGTNAIFTFARECGHDVDLVYFKEHTLNHFDLPTPHETDLLINLLREKKTQLVGISVRSPYLRHAGELTRNLKAALNIPVVWGGQRLR